MKDSEEKTNKMKRSSSATYRNEMNYGVRLYQRACKMAEEHKK